MAPTPNLTDHSVLITGGTGSFGRAMARYLLDRTDARRVVIFSRDELKQWQMKRDFKADPRLRFFLGDIRDRDRLYRAFRGVETVIHAAALKQVPAAEYNPFEAVKTNILGVQNVIDAAIDCGVQRVLGLSTDKASSPSNLYGATKLVGDKLFVSGNAYASEGETKFSVVRYGNVLGSRGSVIPLFREQARTGCVTLTDKSMTRFWITLGQAVDFVAERLDDMAGGEIFIPKIPSMCMLDFAQAVAPGCEVKVVGCRPGEKLHEELVSPSDARTTVSLPRHYLIQPDFDWWRDAQSRAASAPAGDRVPEGFSYTSDRNDRWLNAGELAGMLDD